MPYRLVFASLLLLWQSQVFANETGLANDSFDIDRADLGSATTEQPSNKEKAFQGEGSLGLIINSGNSNNKSLNGNIKAQYKHSKWQHKFEIKAKKVQEKEKVKAERYLFTENSSYTFSERTFAFVSLRYDDDRFDGFDYQASLSSGLGWHLIDQKKTHLDVELGLGRRENVATKTQIRTEENIRRFSQHFNTTISKTTKLTEDILVESSDQNTTSEFNVGVRVAINTAVALKVGYNVKKNSDPPENTEPTDRTTSVTLVFGF